jgi:hypothetical protein
MSGNEDRRVHDAVTNLSAYALTLEVERKRLDDRLIDLARIESSAADRRALLRERDEIGRELNAFRRAIRAFQADVALLAASRH